MAHKSVINVGIAVTAQITDNFYYAGSLRTDFNFFDDKTLDRQADFVPNMTYWDIYHITSGIILTGPRAELSVGINYGFGFSSGDLQIVNMSNPTQENFLQGELNSNTNTQYANIGFVLGFNYGINRMKGLKEEKL